MGNNVDQMIQIKNKYETSTVEQKKKIFVCFGEQTKNQLMLVSHSK